MVDFTAHEGQDSVIVRGSMHHAIMTVSEFKTWLEYEDCNHGAWYGPAVSQMCLIRRKDGSVRSTAVRFAAENFEPVF